MNFPSVRTIAGRCVLSTALLILFAPAMVAGDLHDLYRDILADHVKAGLVDYGSLSRDARLAQYCRMLAETDPHTLGSEKDRLAFWINAYNAFTLRIVADHYPIKSVNELHSGGLILGSLFKTTVWDKKLVTINGEKTTLNWIEHKMIRKNFKDPRVHFALVCASRSCPPLRNEPYLGIKLDEQLDDQARIFITDPARNSFDPEAREARLSKTFDWFSEDFGGKRESVLRFVARYLPNGLRQAVQTDTGTWKVNYLKYDWNLNDAPGAGASPR